MTLVELSFSIFIVILFYIILNLEYKYTKDKNLKEVKKIETLPSIPKSTSSGNFHDIICSSNKIQIYNYHYGSNHDQSGIKLCMDIETPWAESFVLTEQYESYNSRFRIQNQDGPEYFYIIGHWEYLICGCMVWHFDVISDLKDVKVKEFKYNMSRD